MLRSDEEANLSEIERDKKFRSNIGSAIKTAGSAALGVGLVSTKLGSKILPFLSEYIPVDLAIKGISKISPHLGSILKKGQSMGMNVKEGLDFVKDKIEKKAEFTQEKQQTSSKEKPFQQEKNKTQKQPKENRNIIEQYSPELHQFIDQEVRKGRPLIQAGALAQNNPKFSQIIEKLQKDHKTPWSQILQSIYGGALKEQSQDQGQMQQPQKGGGQGKDRFTNVMESYMQMKGGK